MIDDIYRKRQPDQVHAVRFFLDGEFKLDFLGDGWTVGKSPVIADAIVMEKVNADGQLVQTVVVRSGQWIIRDCGRDTYQVISNADFRRQYVTVSHASQEDTK